MQESAIGKTASKTVRSKDYDFKVIEKASELVYEKLRADETYPDLADQFTRRIDQPGSHRYFVNYKNIFGHMIEHVNFIPMPTKLREHLNRVETCHYMGIFPEIDRVWVTVDNILYLWNYLRPEDYDVYDGMSEVIVSVSLSTPKPGIFLDSVQYILIVGTSVEVSLLALAFTGSSTSFSRIGAEKSMKLIPTSYTASSDNTTMVKVLGTQSGRIFMAGQDGNLYELYYDNSEDTWSSLLGVDSMLGLESTRNKCRKIHHYQWHWRLVSLLPTAIRNIAFGDDPLIDLCADNVRKLLYTVSSKGHLSVFYLGSDSQDTNCCIYYFSVFDAIKKYVLDRVYLESSLQVDGLKDVSNVSIIGMYVIPITESKKVHLIILLNTGVRLYLRLLYNSSGLSGSVVSNRIPSSIEIAFIRSPPPPNAINASQMRVPLESSMESGVLPQYLPMQLLNVKNGYYCHGMFMSSLSSNADDQQASDKLLAIHEDLMNQNLNADTLVAGQIPNLREAVSIVCDIDGNDVIQGRVYDIKEKDISASSSSMSKLQTLVSLSATPASGQGLYIDEEHMSHQSNVMYSDGMAMTLPSSFVPTSLNPQTRDYSWGFGRSSIDCSMIRSEFVNSHIPTLSSDNHREFLCLTNQGIHILTKITPADVLVRLLSTGQQSYTPATDGSINESFVNEVKMFFRRYGAIQASIMCIALACGLPPSAGGQGVPVTGEVNANIAGRAILAMQRLTQGTHLKAPTTSSMNPVSSDPRLAVRGSMSYDYSTSPVLDGLIYLISRIVRPLWLRSLIKDNEIPAYIDMSIIQSMITLLSRLQVYFEEYHPLVIKGDPIVNITGTRKDGHGGFSSMGGSSSGSVMENLFAMNQSFFSLNNSSSNEKQLHQFAKHLEDATLNALYRLIARTVQALRLLSYFHDLLVNRNINVPIAILNKYTLKSWVMSVNVHEKLKKVIREVLLLFTSDKQGQLSTKSSSNAITSSNNPLQGIHVISAAGAYLKDISTSFGITTKGMFWGIFDYDSRNEDKIEIKSRKKPVIPMIDYSVIVQDFIAKITKDCYYYFSSGDRYAYDALLKQQQIKQFIDHHVKTNQMNIDSHSSSPNRPDLHISTNIVPGNIMLRIESYELRSELYQLMKSCIDLWISAINDWKAVEYVMPSGAVSTPHPSTPQSSASAARSRASFDMSSELSRICTSLRDLGGYCRAGIVDICINAAGNFYPNKDSDAQQSDIASIFAPAVRRAYLSDKPGMKNVLTVDEWEHAIYHGRPSLNDDVLNRARRECYNCLIHHFLQIIHITRFYPSIASSSHDHLNNYSPIDPKKSTTSTLNDFEPTLQDMIDRSLDICTDAMYQDLLLNTLLKESPKHIIQLHSTHTGLIETFLREKDPLVLYRHYEYHEEYSKGAALMASLAQSERSLAIQLRVEYLRSAVASASMALRQTTSSSSHSIMSMSSIPSHDIYKDLYDVAVIQQTVYETITSSPYSQLYPAVSHPIIHQLHMQLMTISDIFNQVTQPFHLWDLSLLMLQTSKHEDNEMIQRLWRSIVYRLVPIQANSSVGDAFLQSKRQSDYLDIDATIRPQQVTSGPHDSKSYQSHAVLEIHDTWRNFMISSLISITTRILAASNHQEISSQILKSKPRIHLKLIRQYFPLVLILEELEDISVTWFMIGNPAPRGWIMREYLSKISCLNPVDVIEEYMVLLDKLVGLSTERLLLTLSSASYLLKTWMESVIQDRGSDPLAYRELVHDVQTKKVQLWLDKLNRYMNTLIGRSSMTYPDNRVQETKDLLELVAKDIRAIGLNAVNVTIIS